MSLAEVRAEVQRCRACDLWKGATQAVFGEGPAHAALMLVGETPGDQEDKTGHPFVGPAGALLDAGLEAAGIDRATVYLTNVVKHFRWERGAKTARRIHKKPNAAEITLVKPRVIVCLGATAAQALLGKSFRVTKQRGVPVPSPLAPAVVATVHPSSVLRAPDDEARHKAEAEFFADLAAVAKLVAG